MAEIDIEGTTETHIGMGILTLGQKHALLFETDSKTVSLVTKTDDGEERNLFSVQKDVKQIACLESGVFLVSGEEEIFIFNVNNGKTHHRIIQSPLPGNIPFGLCVNEDTNSIWAGFYNASHRRYNGVIRKYQKDSLTLTFEFGDKINLQKPIKITTNNLGSILGILSEQMDGSREMVLLTPTGEEKHRCETKQGDTLIIDIAISENENVCSLLSNCEIFLLKKSEYQPGTLKTCLGRRIFEEHGCVAISISYSNKLWLRLISDEIKIRTFSDSSDETQHLEVPSDQLRRRVLYKTQYPEVRSELYRRRALHESKDSSGVFSDIDVKTTSRESLFDSLDEVDRQASTNESREPLIESFLDDTNEKYYLMLNNEDDLDRLIEEFCQEQNFGRSEIENIRRDIERDTHLHFAMKNKHEDLLLKLLRSSADLSKTGYNNDFPFEAIVERDHFQRVYNILCGHFKKAVMEIYIDISPFVWKVSLCYCKQEGQKHGLAVTVYISRNTSVANVDTFKINNVRILFIFKKDVNLEGETVQMHEHKENSRCNFGLESKLAEELFEKHSNLNAIRPSRLRSMGFGTPNHRIIQQSCIVLYCSKKGYIPINEESFPMEINGIRTDVREGYFMFGADELRQGDSIFRKSKVGTLGGFVEFPDKTLGFLTCAHVLFDMNELYKLRSGCLADDIELLVFKERNRNIGRIVDARFTSDIENEISIDAAVIKIPGINERFVDSSYPDIHDLKGLSRAPSFSEPDPNRRYQRTCRVIKFGCSTGFTVGMLQLDSKSHVRISNEELRINENSSDDSMDTDDNKCFKMFNQLCVSPSIDHNFFSAGDSGSFVYILTDPANNTYECIGMAIGVLSDGVCLVTHIENVLNSFQNNLKLRIPRAELGAEYVTKDSLQLELSKNFSPIGAKLDEILRKMSSLDSRVQRLEEKTRNINESD